MLTGTTVPVAEHVRAAIGEAEPDELQDTIEKEHVSVVWVGTSMKNLPRKKRWRMPMTHHQVFRTSETSME